MPISEINSIGIGDPVGCEEYFICTLIRAPLKLLVPPNDGVTAVGPVVVGVVVVGVVVVVVSALLHDAASVIATAAIRVIFFIVCSF